MKNVQILQINPTSSLLRNVLSDYFTCLPEVIQFHFMGFQVTLVNSNCVKSLEYGSKFLITRVVLGSNSNL
jgi:hypothetical protein